MTITFEISRERGGLQLSVNEVDERGSGGGYRIFGPKFSGTSTVLRSYVVDERDAREVIRYMQRVLDKTGAVDG